MPRILRHYRQADNELFPMDIIRLMQRLRHYGDDYVQHDDEAT